ncbi:MAG TPA: hypothetical protein VL354_13060 [Spirochaetia bacterium]|nr:hypothetical protein [Spirochaetia bacterium]
MPQKQSNIVVRVFSSVVAIGALLFVVECTPPTNTTPPNPADVASVGTVAPSELQSSTVTPGTVPTGSTALNTLATALSAIGDTDPVVSDVMNSFDSGTFVPTGFDKLITDIENFPTTKSLNDTVSFSGNGFGHYVKLTTATSTLSGSAVTSDGGPLKDPSKLSSANGQFSLSVVFDPQTALYTAGSAIKDFKFRFNAGGTATYSVPNVTFDYGESLVLAFTFYVASSGTGGKVVLTVNARNTGSASLSSGDFSNLASSMTATLQIYDNSNTVQYEKTWTDVDSLVADLSPVLGGI